MDIELIKTWLGTGAINVFGRPFAGKDTVCARLGEDLDGVVLGGGDILRNSVIPPHVKEIIDSGALAPTDDYIDIVLPYLSKAEFADKSLILSSVGRWIGEEQGVLQAAEKSGHGIKAVIYLDISNDVARERLNNAHTTDRESRADDTLATLEKRFNEFEEKTLPVIHEYEKLGLLVRIDGSAPHHDVYTAVISALATKAHI
ncbi:MAG TPA: nucleoside monophosphate kinase [Candidatus Saccharimonadales bacterium]